MMLWLRRFFGVFFALLILFEEWGWEPLQAMLGRIARLPPLAWLERRIAALPPYAALGCFVLPALLLLPVKLAALWLIAHGKTGLGLLVIAIAKLVGTAVLARLFALTRPALMRLAWFARWYARWASWKGFWIARVRASWAWRRARVAKRWLLRHWPRGA